MEEDKNRSLLDEEIEREFNNLIGLMPGTDEHSKATSDLEKLYKMKIEDDKVQWDFANKVDERDAQINDRKLDRESRERQAKEDRDTAKFNWKKEAFPIAAKFVADLGIAFVTFKAYDLLTTKGLIFEKEGSVVSMTARSIFQNAYKTRK